MPQAVRWQALAGWYGRRYDAEVVIAATGPRVHALRALSRRFMPAAALGLAVSTACGSASGQASSRVPTMDQIGHVMVRLGEALRDRGTWLHGRAAAAATGPAAAILQAAGDRWWAEGEALVAEGGRIVRAATIVGQTAGSAQAAPRGMYLFGVEAEADALLTTARRLEERSRALRTGRAALEGTAALTAAEAAPLLADVEALAALAAEARRTGEAMREQAARQRRALGQRPP